MAIFLYSQVLIRRSVHENGQFMREGDVTPFNPVVRIASGYDTLYCLQEEEDKAEGQIQFTSKAALPRRQKTLFSTWIHMRLDKKKKKTPHG